LTGEILTPINQGSEHFLAIGAWEGAFVEGKVLTFPLHKRKTLGSPAIERVQLIFVAGV
jgi:hypothetical protein